MQQHHSKALCPGSQTVLPAPATATQPGGHAGGRQETHSPEEWGSGLLPVAEERAPELDLPPQRAALEPEGSINPQNVALGVVCSRKRRAEKKV